MQTTVVKLLISALALTVLTSIVLGQELAPDLILFNGKVFTSSPSQPYVEAIAVRGERIVAVGTSKKIVSLAGHQTRQMDLGGRTVIQGINDAHAHLGVSPHTYDLPIKSYDPTWQEIKDALTTAVTTVPKGTWIVGKFGSNLLDDPKATRAGLDALAPDHLVVLWDLTGHASLMNTAALRKLGVRDDEPNPEGGLYARNPANGQLTGMVFEFAQFRIGRRFSELSSDQEAVQQLREYFDGSEDVRGTRSPLEGHPLGEGSDKDQADLCPQLDAGRSEDSAFEVRCGDAFTFGCGAEVVAAGDDLQQARRLRLRELQIGRQETEGGVDDSGGLSSTRCDEGGDHQSRCRWPNLRHGRKRDQAVRISYVPSLISVVLDGGGREPCCHTSHVASHTTRHDHVLLPYA